MMNTDASDHERDREFEELSNEPSREQDDDAEEIARKSDEAEFEELAEEPAREDDASDQKKPG